MNMDMPKDSQETGKEGAAEAARQGTGTASRRGSASSLFLGALAILVAVGAAAWFLQGTGNEQSPTEAVQPEVTSDAETRPEPPPGMMRESDLLAMEANGPRTMGGIETRPSGGYEPFEKVFGDPGGTIVGEIRVQGTDFPESWTVTIEPSLAAEGRDKAITRTFESEPGMRTFELRDLPLAAYRISARAPGMATSKIEVALYRVAERPGQRGLDFVNLDLTLRPMALVEGFIRQLSGDAANDLAVYLVPYQVPGQASAPISAPTGAPATAGTTAGNTAESPSGGNVITSRLETRTNSAGSFTFEQVPAGPWMLHVGDPVRSLIAPTPVGVQSQDLRVDDLTLPALASLDLVIMDYIGRPCPDVTVTGYLKGAGRGSFKITTDSVGEVHLRYLTPGPWRVEAKDNLIEQKGRADLVLTPEGPAHGRIEEIIMR